MYLYKLFLLLILLRGIFIILEIVLIISELLIKFFLFSKVFLYAPASSIMSIALSGNFFSVIYLFAKSIANCKASSVYFKL